MAMDLEGKTALVTGSGKRTGIGFAIAQKLASCGANVILADLGKADDLVASKTGTQEEMSLLAAELGDRYGVKTMAVAVDVTDPESIAAMAKQVRGAFETLEVLCNNAGATFGVPNLFHTYDEALWMRTIDVNLHSVFRITRALLPMMFGRPGSVINTASRAGKVPPVFNGAYAVAKAGVIMLTKVMAKELAPAGVRVNAICPGQIMTDMEKWRFGLEADAMNETVEQRVEKMCETIPLCRIGKPEEVAKVVAFLASDQSSYMTGQALNITGGQLMEL